MIFEFKEVENIKIGKVGQVTIVDLDLRSINTGMVIKTIVA